MGPVLIQQSTNKFYQIPITNFKKLISDVVHKNVIFKQIIVSNKPRDGVRLVTRAKPRLIKSVVIKQPN